MVDDNDLEYGHGEPEKRPAMLYAPIYNGLAAGLSICKWLSDLGYRHLVGSNEFDFCFTVFIGNGVNTILVEFQLDKNFARFALVAVLPLLFCVALVRSAIFNPVVSRLTCSASRFPVLLHPDRTELIHGNRTHRPLS